MKRIRITVMDFRMYFGFMYGILFDGRIITRKTRKSHRNTENTEITQKHGKYKESVEWLL